MRKTKEKREYYPGDVVRFKNVNRIVLNKVTMDTGIEIYHIYNPERGVYSAHEEELEYIDHINEWDNIIQKFNELSMSKSA